MNRLTALMYGTYADPKEGLFGFKSGRIVMGGTEACHELQWYNLFGAKIGEGSFAANDLVRIAQGLLETELFAILDTPADIRILQIMQLVPPSTTWTNADLTIDGLQSFARCIVAQGAIYVPTDNPQLTALLRKQHIAFCITPRSAIRHLIAETRAKNIAQN